MTAVDRQQLLSALLLVVMALFVSAAAPFGGRWRRTLRLAAIIGFGVAVALALVEINIWWSGGSQ